MRGATCGVEVGVGSGARRRARRRRFTTGSGAGKGSATMRRDGCAANMALRVARIPAERKRESLSGDKERGPAESRPAGP